MKIVFVIFTCFFFSYAFSQDSTKVTSSDKKKFTLPNRPNDHLLIQFSYDSWSGMPDSIKSHKKGFPRGFNAYFMLDKPFNTSPKFSIGLGVGVSTSNIYFERINIDLKSNSIRLPFTSLDSSNHFKKYKIATAFLEVPLEFRYLSKPTEPNKSFKVALGGRIGALVNVHTKGKTLQDKNDRTINEYLEKENSKRFINGTRFMATARVGYGIFSVFGAYQINSILKDAAGPAMHLYQVGLTLSGL